ncbi:MAG: FAD-linked oxidase C-terminal domain-containing protein [Gammaproteobacteria bacterium]|nr:FAD-linked oxidase C-terminal domain-containing protein [Gammaproteobacteria bacterium]
MDSQTTIPTEAYQKIQDYFGDRCSRAESVCLQHGRDESPFPVTPPELVVFAMNHEEIIWLVNIARHYLFPIIPFGAGTSLEGQLLAVNGGVSLDLSRMNQILHISPDDLTVTVHPGVTRIELNNQLKSYGLFFPVDPGANATIGGMCATGASGTNAVRYGTMRNNVLSMKIVTPQGVIIKTGSQAKKSSAGYDLTHLYIGSEGTLGVIVEITLRVYSLPESVAVAICSFPSIANAVKATIQIIQTGIAVARVELIDSNSVLFVNNYSKLHLPVSPMLLFEFHGSDTVVAEDAERTEDISLDHEGNNFQWVTTPEARTKLWAARHNAYFAALQAKPGCRIISTDTCVPISRLADCLLDSLNEVKETTIPFFLVGHVGDGNFHFGYMIDPNSPDEWALAEKLNTSLVMRAIEMGGTCSGEHGVGVHKKKFLEAELGKSSIDVMRMIKKSLDPHNIFNPGKILN